MFYILSAHVTHRPFRVVFHGNQLQLDQVDGTNFFCMGNLSGGIDRGGIEGYELRRYGT